eukprot:TRINITY_DN1881_c0_g1_i1.p1 TRINITY_DN1881_c0_g1~~TRINITY_DN1881_c0_g1_i1.p1  ORF type:complete len:439 (+),score=77.64 TRINITY_DN1881_c0_g1_i1:93-1409(+)
MAHLIRPLILLLLFIVISVLSANPDYDHQTVTYVSHLKPEGVTDKKLHILPFFSPDHSAFVQTSVVENAQVSVDIAIPSWSAWNGCSTACTPSKMRQDTFPVWQALLNALHRGIRVRILINDYNDPAPAEGLISPLIFLYLNGADIRFFTSVTFMHSKYIATESTASVSSVNFSYTAFMKNREAGVVINGSDSDPLRTFFNTTFNEDFNAGYAFKPTSTYSSELMAIITNTSSIPVVVPPRLDINAYITPLTKVDQKMNSFAIASPDFAYETITTALSQAKHTIQVYIYQITDDMCEFLPTISRDVSVKILVSARIYSVKDAKLAEECYKNLTDEGFSIQVAPDVFQYSHNKFWILDHGHPSATMFVSTGNWGNTDYPNGPSIFPPYTKLPNEWRPINRDFTVQISDSDVIEIFKKTLDEDYAQGTPYKDGAFLKARE